MSSFTCAPNHTNSTNVLVSVFVQFGMPVFVVHNEYM